jgi:hypothetical protein
MNRWVGLGASQTTSSTSATRWQNKRLLKPSQDHRVCRPPATPGGFCVARRILNGCPNPRKDGGGYWRRVTAAQLDVVCCACGALGNALALSTYPQDVRASYGMTACIDANWRGDNLPIGKHGADLVASRVLSPPRKTPRHSGQHKNDRRRLK